MPGVMRTAMTKVFVTGLKVQAEIGVYRRQLGRAQPLVIDVQLDGLTLIIGVIMAYVLRSGAGDMNGSHYTYVIRTFWISLVWLIIGGGVMLVSIPFTFILIGIPFLWLGGVICGAAWLWALIRCIVGVVRLADGAPIARPYGYFV